MKIADFLAKSYNERELYPGYKIIDIRPHIICKDGFTISIQASEMHYCSPRTNISTGNYKEVECGFPSEIEHIPYDEVTENELQYYAEDPSNLTGTVYGYVPIDVVERLLEQHGGIDEGKTFA